MSRRVLLAFALCLGLSTALWAICSPDPCPTGQPFQTPWVWGVGPTCNDAYNDAWSQAFSHAVSNCGRAILVCNFQLFANPCFWNSQKQAYQVDAYAKYNCTTCSDIIIEP
jgi:hypothetical protein